MKVIFFDIDGTLVDMANGIHDIPDNAKKEIRRIQNMGHKVLIASGRPSAFISKNLLSFGFDGFVLCNGAHVKIDGKEFKTPLDQEKVRSLIKRLDEHQLEYIIQTSTLAYMKDTYKGLMNFYEKGCGFSCDAMESDYQLEDILLEIMKLEVWIQEDEKNVASVVGNEFAFDSHGTGKTYEVYSKDVSKANGVMKVLEYLHVDPMDSYAFGDGTNDLQMFEVVHTAIAMGNAEQVVKEKADLITDRIECDGVANMLQQLF